MGFCFAGVIINKKFDTKIEDLGNLLNLEFKKESNIYFEEAITEFSHGDKVDLFFTDQATLLIMDIDICLDYYPIKGLDTLSFSIDERSNTFAYFHSQNNKEVKDDMSYPQMINEYKPDDKFDLGAYESKVVAYMSNVAKEILGQDIYNVDLGEMGQRYRISRK